MAKRTNNGKRRRTIIFIAVLIFGFYFEYFIYYTKTWSWEPLNCPTSSHCSKFLLVADPQILGERDESNWITIWDSDRYLRLTYSLAVNHVQPDAVIFLGDLMDEGNRADDEEFERYVDRFFKIFPPNKDTKTLFLPGDNDIGGENGDPILPSVVYRFRRTFHKKIELVVGSCRIVKVNPVLESLPNLDPRQVLADRHIRIAVSHFPLLGMSTPFTAKMVKELQPHLIFSAHSHLSRLRVVSKNTPSTLSRLGPISIRHKNRTRDSEYDDSSPNSSGIHEVEVPTCSYRMGVQYMGFGFALIDETRQELLYTVLWLPPRLIVLKLYLVAASVCSIVTLWWCFCMYGRSPHKYCMVYQP